MRAITNTAHHTQSAQNTAHHTQSAHSAAHHTNRLQEPLLSLFVGPCSTLLTLYSHLHSHCLNIYYKGMITWWDGGQKRDESESSESLESLENEKKMKRSGKLGQSRHACHNVQCTAIASTYIQCTAIASAPKVCRYAFSTTYIQCLPRLVQLSALGLTCSPSSTTPGHAAVSSLQLSLARPRLSPSTVRQQGSGREATRVTQHSASDTTEVTQ